jgi:hypothetical protein
MWDRRCVGERLTGCYRFMAASKVLGEETVKGGKGEDK